MPVRPLLEAALELDAIDLNVMPVVPATKRPAERWKRFQTERTTDRLRPWFAGRSNYWLGVVCGSISGVVVLDIDSLEALAFWREQLGESLEATVHSRTPKAASKGEGVGHYWFRLPKVGPVVPCRGDHDENDPDGIHWDIKAEGGYVVSPPSEGYEWVRSPWDTELVEMPKALEGKKKKPAKGQAPMKRGRQAELIDNPGMGGRNQWVTDRLGHYARLHRQAQARDLYDAEAERLWREASEIEGDHPYEREEFEKSRDGIWRTDQQQLEDVHIRCTERTGWLVSSGDGRLMVQCRGKDDDGEAVFYHDEWGDFDVEALGVVEADDTQRVYDVVLHRHAHGDTKRALLEASTLSDPRKLNGWLREEGVGILEPQAMWPKTGSRADRLGRYIDAQKPSSFKVVQSLGWDDEANGFVCHEGVITADNGLADHQGIRPHPRLRGWAKYEYGFSSEKAATEVLRQVLTFHDETTTAVFGAWWTACFLKPQIDQWSDVFPAMVIEAPSESGKSRGFFSLMLQLSGNMDPQTEMTPAALRDAMSAHKSGIVWNDDLSHIDLVWDIVRQATSGGTRVKKGEDRTEQVRAQMSAPFVLSGEVVAALEKARVDRMVKLKVGSPINRMSLLDPARPQIDDIRALKNAEGHLSRHAGTIVELVLQRVDEVHRMDRYRMVGARGRWADKMAILRLGAAVLADIVGDDTIVQRVDEWCSEQVDYGSHNWLTMELLPLAIRHIGHQVEPISGSHGWPDTPVLVRNGVVWFSPAHLADWSRRHFGREERLASKESLIDQAKRLGMGGANNVARKQVRMPGGNRPWFWLMTPELSEQVLGWADDGMTEGMTAGMPPHQGELELATTREPFQDSGYDPGRSE